MKLRTLKILIPGLFAISALTGCGRFASYDVVIYTSSDENEMALIRTMLKEKFPNLSISVEYYSTGTHAAKLKVEKSTSLCDITYDLEEAYMVSLDKEGIFADLSSYSTDKYVSDLVKSTNFLPTMRYGGAIIFNDTVFEQRQLEKPKSYEDLLKPEYKKLISMPNPTSSGTGYMFLYSLVKELGETAAFNYFDELANSILAFTASGSAPIKSLIQGEVAIAIGMTSSYANYKSQGHNLSLDFFDPGSPYNACGTAIIKGKESKPHVKEVFDYFYTDITEEICRTLYPEKIYKDKDFDVPNFPKDIKYASMEGDSPEVKEALLAKWKHV